MKYKHITALLTAAALLLCGCQSVPKTDPAAVEQPTIQTDADGDVTPLAEDPLTDHVKAERLTPPNELGWITSAVQTADGILLLGNSTAILRYEPASGTWTQTELAKMAPYEGFYDCGGLVSAGEDGFHRLTVMENHNNMDPADGGDTNYDFWEQYYSSCVTEFWLCTYAPDGTLSGKVQVTGLEDYPDADGNILPHDLLWEDDGGFLTLMDGTILRITADGSVTKTEDAPDGDNLIRRALLRDRDGGVLLCDTCEETAQQDGALSWVTTIRAFDTTTGKPGAALLTAAEPFSGYNTQVMSGGSGEYRLFVNDEKHLLGIKDDGATETVIDWSASDLDPMSVVPLADGRFVSYSFDSSGGFAFYLLTRLKASEATTDLTLTIAVLSRDYALKDFVQNYNRSHSNVRLATHSYTDNADKTAIEQLKMDLVTDKAPDLVVMYEQHEQFLKLGSKGVFADLNEFMANDPEVSRDKMLPNVLTAMQHPNGALYALASGFIVDTIAVKTKFSDKENWTVDDMLALYDGADDIVYYWSTKDEALQMFLAGSDFTDELAGTCNFDSPEFVKILEFCSRYPAETTCPPKQEDDWTAHDNWYTEKFYSHQRDQDYLYPFAISAPGGGISLSEWSYVKTRLGGDMTLVGFPSDNGQGGKIKQSDGAYTNLGEMGIVSTCKHPDAAWDVVRAYTLDSMEYAERPAFSLFEDKFEEQMDGTMYVWEDGKPSDEKSVEDDGTVYPLTQEERDDLERYIRGCTTYMMLDSTVKNIVLEEAGKYFSGDCTAEDAAKAIQSRAALYLSEQS